MTRLLLVGCTASGRTSVGSALALRLGWPFLDDDAVVERTVGLAPRLLHERDGAEAVAATTSGALNLLLGVPGPLVATVPSGAVADAGCRARLRAAGHVVWLRAGAPVLARRVRGDGGRRARPWLGEDPPAELRRLLAEREGLYAEVAHQVVDTDVLPVGAVVRLLLEGLPPGLRAQGARA